MIGLASLAYFTGENAITPALPRFVTGPLGGGSIAVGTSFAALSLTALLFRPWAGRLGDRRGRRLLLVAGAGLFAASVAGYLVATSLPVLIALRLVTGVGEAFFFVGAASAVTDLAPAERRGEAVSIFSLALYVGLGVGPILGEAALGQDRFFAVWLVAAGAGAVAVLLGLRVPETRDLEAAAPSDAARLIHPAGLLPGVAILAAAWAMAGFFAFVPLYALQIGLSGSRLVFLTLSGVVISIRSFGARIPDVLGARVTSRTALLLSASGLTVIGLWRTPAGLFAGVVVFAVGQALAFPGMLSLAVAGAPASERGSVVGTFTAFFDLGYGVGPATLGVVAAAVGYPGTFLAAAGVDAAGFLLLVALGSRTDRER
jgi:predicted MFS family arabinose efflux permease